MEVLLIMEEMVEELGEVFSIARKRLPCPTHSEHANIRVVQGHHEAAQSLRSGLQAPKVHTLVPVIRGQLVCEPQVGVLDSKGSENNSRDTQS